MRQKLVALVGAIAIIVVAFVGRGLLFDDDDGPSIGSDSDRLLCPADFREICEKIDGDLDIRFEEAGETAGRLIETTDPNELDGRAWIVPRAWAEMIVAERDFQTLPPLFQAAGEPIASTSIHIIIWSDQAAALGCGNQRWTCLAEGAGESIPGSPNTLRVGTPEMTGATGLPVAAAVAVGVLDGEAFDPDEIPRAARLGDRQSQNPLTRMLTRGPGELTAVAVAATDARIPAHRQSEVTAWTDMAPPIRVDLVVMTPLDQEVDKGLADDVADAFRDSGWSAGVDGTDGLPNGDLLAQIWKQWPR